MTDKDGDGIDDYFFDSLFSDPEPTLPKPSGRKSATPIVVPSVSAPSQKRDSFVPVNKRALAEYTPKDLAMWNIIFGLLTAVRK